MLGLLLGFELVHAAVTRAAGFSVISRLICYRLFIVACVVGLFFFWVGGVA